MAELALLDLPYSFIPVLLNSSPLFYIYSTPTAAPPIGADRHVRPSRHQPHSILSLGRPAALGKVTGP